jgi:hypothetical protein
MRAARIGVKVAFALRDDADAGAPTTIVKVSSDAELGGVLADFARTGGVAVANVLMQDFARRAADEFAKDAPPPVAAAARTDQPHDAATPATSAAPMPAVRTAAAPQGHAAAAPATLSAHGVLWEVIKLKLRQLARWLGLRAKDA